MAKYEFLITHHSGSLGDEFLQDFVDSIEKKVKFGVKVDISDWQLDDDQSATGELHSVVETVLQRMDTHSESDFGVRIAAPDVFMVSLFRDGKVVNKFLYHAMDYLCDCLGLRFLRLVEAA